MKIVYDSVLEELNLNLFKIKTEFTNLNEREKKQSIHNNFFMTFTLRPWTIDDLESLVKYANNYNIAKNLTDKFPYPYSIDNGRFFIDSATKNSPFNILAIDINNEAAGGIGIHPQSDIHYKNAELGYWLAEPFWGNGIITKAIKQMVEYGFTNWDINRIFARPFETNIASQRVLEKAGFILEGRFKKTLFKNGEYLDELVYAVRLTN